MSNTMLVLVLIGLLFIIIAAVAIVIVLAFKTKRKKKPSQVAKENDELKKNSKKWKCEASGDGCNQLHGRFTEINKEILFPGWC